MATGVKSRDEDHQFTRSDLEALEDAMKNKKFRDLLVDYFEEVRDPANQAIYQKEMTQLEKERGYDITFINPKGGYVIKTSVAGDRKAFINICSNDNVDKPSCSVKEVDGRRGMNWLIPYSLIPPRDDFDHKREKCVIYDVVFHPDTLRMAQVNKRFRELVNNTAFDALRSTYNIDLDSNNFRFPKSLYKGLSTPAVIRKEDPNFKPPSEEEASDCSTDLLEKLYPQQNYPKPKTEEPKVNKNHESTSQNRDENIKFVPSYTVPKYVIKQQKTVDMQDYTFDKDSKQYSAIPSHIVIHIYLPLLSSTKDCALDVQEKSLYLSSEKPAKYKLELPLPYSVNDQCGEAKFDKSKRILTVTLPVVQQKLPFANSFIKTDSDLDSEEYSRLQNGADDTKQSLVTEISSEMADDLKSVPAGPEVIAPKEDLFLEPSLGYILPPYTHNVLDTVVAFTFHVKNTEPNSVVVKRGENSIQIKFTSVGSGFVPVYYSALLVFDNDTKFEDVNGEAWDNNVILQIELSNSVPQKYQIGLSQDSLTSEYFDVSISNKPEFESCKIVQNNEDTEPIVEVTNSGNETSITVTSKTANVDDNKTEDSEAKEIIWVEDNTRRSKAQSILRKHGTHSFSESSVGDVASSMDYISSDYVPEESSLKKTVRFSNVIAKQFYRHNSSIASQNKKNQRKKSKKRSLARRKSESEAEDDNNITVQVNKPKMKTAWKQRRDSGLADTSDAEMDYKNSPVTSSNDKNHMNMKSTTNESPHDTPDDKKENQTQNPLTVAAGNGNVESNSAAYVFRDSQKDNVKSESLNQTEGESPDCNNIKHNTKLYNPEKLNKGQYSEVKFKNDLIFDLDM